MEEAIIGASVALVLFVLSRVPGFTVATRLAAAIERDLKIVAKLPDGRAKDDLNASVERRVYELLALRGEGVGAAGGESSTTGGKTEPMNQAAARSSALSRGARLFAVVTSALAIGIAVTTLIFYVFFPSGFHEDATANNLIGLAITAVIAGVVVVRWVHRERRRPSSGEN